MRCICKWKISCPPPLSTLKKILYPDFATDCTWAIFWAATTLYVKRITEKVNLNHYQTLFAQLIYSFPLLAMGSVVFELPADLNLTPLVLASLFYQSVIVAFASFLVWFWLIHRYTVSRLAAFTFLAPLFGVILGGLILNEPITLLVWVGLACVGGGLYLVNRWGANRLRISL